MTPAQIEAAARELCKMRGKDPDAPDEIGYKVDFRPFSMTSVPIENWRSVVSEVERFAQVGTAIAAVMQAPRAPRKRKTK